jgi:hypothetical protein
VLERAVCITKSFIGYLEDVCPHRENREESFFNFHAQGTALTQSPTTRNYTPELSAFGIIARISPDRGAMVRPCPRGTSLVITVSPVPGKYDY